MATVIADNILSPLGLGTQETLNALISGKSTLSHYESYSGVPFPFTASLFSKEQNEKLQIDGYTRFESLAIHSISAACSECCFDKSNAALIISSTKGNVDLLKANDNPEYVTSLGASAKRIAKAVGFETDPIVVCNACISGVSASVLANRLIEAQEYNHIIVCGIDIQSPFIISGFQSLKALSETECRPFDIERVGLNLGEAAATMILSANENDESLWTICQGAIKNDAYHISSPHPQGEGCMKAIQATIKDTNISDLALVNAHGTATMYNDQMESKAISRSGLSEIPTNALKGYLGHTMGAAGVVETILSMHALDKGLILASRGFEEIGVSGKININASCLNTNKNQFLKIISGFGGCNGAILVGKGNNKQQSHHPISITIKHRVKITPSSVNVDGNNINIEETEVKMLTSLYKQCGCDYPKYYKMDNLAKLGFISTELLLNAEGGERFVDNYHRAVVFFNKMGSLPADNAYLESISDIENYYPSPSIFVYTLPNIVVGEVAIRNKCYGETGFYILPEKNQNMIDRIINTVFQDNDTHSIIAGWVEYVDDSTFESDIYIVESNKQLILTSKNNGTAY